MILMKCFEERNIWNKNWLLNALSTNLPNAIFNQLVQCKGWVTLSKFFSQMIIYFIEASCLIVCLNVQCKCLFIHLFTNEIPKSEYKMKSQRLLLDLFEEHIWLQSGF